MTTTNTATEPDLRQPTLARPEAMRLAATEYGRFGDVVTQLTEADWVKPTDCTEWVVHQLIAHVVGMAAMAASPVENIRQSRIAKQRPNGEALMIDALTGLQVRKFGRHNPAELTALVAKIGLRAARGRLRSPWFIRRRALPEPQVLNGIPERWSLGYLIDVILTRDTWMHRIDLCRATGRPLVLTADHDGLIVDDVVAEWAQRHGRPYQLTLTGPAGGTWKSAADTGVTSLELDAIEFCRALSGRAPVSGLFNTEVPF